MFANQRLFKFSSVVMSSLFVSSCALKSPRSQESATAPAPSVTSESMTLKKEITGQGETALAQALQKPALHSLPEGNVNPEKSLGWLKNGNLRFVKKNLRSDGQGSVDVQRLASGQKPHAIVLSCSDSRVPPEIVFDQKLGEIFVVRTAGQSVDDNVVGSIEYAVEHLGARLILVMGHTSCGAVKAAHGTLGGGDAGTPALNQLVQSLHPHISVYGGMAPSAGYAQESWSNVQGVAKDLLKRSSLLSHAVETGQVKLSQGMYMMNSGVVEFK
jgi:carbonic anhydrase